MPIKYPRTCDACGSTYSYDSGFAKHRTNGRCVRKQQAVTSASVYTPSDTTINTVVNVKVNENDRVRQLEEHISQLQAQNEILRASTSDVTLPLTNADCLHIYVVQTRHAMEMKLSVYKVGVTQNIVGRTQQYPKKSIVLFSQKYPNARIREPLLHKALKAQPQFKSRSDWGREYYEGDVHEIIEFVSTYMKN